MSSGKALKKAFASCFFDPRKPSTLSTICESNDPDYLLERSIEVLRDAKRFNGIERWAKVRDAVAILAYSMTLTPEETTAHRPCTLCHKPWLDHLGDLRCPDRSGTYYQDPDRGA